ncbi:YciI family protein [Piscinibacter sakaiensis]|uniref:YCII-related domain-containing protein n=1 Tax=Piscinibacter sakaiensis TaxID=1547922 RepID=A0A0K8P6I9_PISS1|nr:YciI family protein [Piscinibacter sakaiensis]GAP38298.1 hypothetical protein ISF6_4756 [Piscinibacter sakaiensis]
MRYLLLLRAPEPPPPAQWLAWQAELERGGVLLDAQRLLPAAPGCCLRREAGGEALRTAPPPADAASLCGYLLIEARSAEEARAWACRLPWSRASDAGGAPDGAFTLELRPLAEAPPAPAGPLH